MAGAFNILYITERTNVNVIVIRCSKSKGKPEPGAGTLDRKPPADEGELAEGCLTPVRSITEIYRSAETRLQKLMAHPAVGQEDNRSDSSIEGG